MDEECFHCLSSLMRTPTIVFETCMRCNASVCLSCRSRHLKNYTDHFFNIPVVQSGSYCDIHRKQLLKYYCFDCMIPFCEICREHKKHSHDAMTEVVKLLKREMKEERELIQKELKLIEIECYEADKLLERQSEKLYNFIDDLEQVRRKVSKMLLEKIWELSCAHFGINPDIDTLLTKVKPSIIRKRINTHLNHTVKILNGYHKDPTFFKKCLNYKAYRKDIVIPKSEKCSLRPVDIWYQKPSDEELQNLLLRYGFGQPDQSYRKRDNPVGKDEKSLLQERDKLVDRLESEISDRKKEIGATTEALKWTTEFAKSFLLPDKNKTVDATLARQIAGYPSIHHLVDNFMDHMRDIRKDLTNKDLTIKKLERTLEDSKSTKERNIPQKGGDRLRETSQQINILEHEIKEFEESIRTSNKKNSDLQLELERTENEKEEFRSSYEELSKQYVVLKHNLESAERDSEDLRLRLSQVSGAKLTAGNAGIADLGDRYRPTKIAEMFSELYDTEWTEAMDELVDIKPEWSEMVIVRHLFVVLQSCYQSCHQIANEQIVDIFKQLTIGVETEQMDRWFEQHVAETKQIRDTRKKLAFNMAEHIKKIIFERQLFAVGCSQYGGVDTQLIAEIKKKPFTGKCISISWLMVVQDPEMYIDEDINSGAPLEKDKYREYTKSGPKVAFAVWPALFLKKNGPMMIKGVVQCTK